jgi:hypothetical protein
MPDKYECETCGSDIRAGFVENENAVMEYGENPEYDMKACREHIDKETGGQRSLTPNSATKTCDYLKSRRQSLARIRCLTGVLKLWDTDKHRTLGKFLQMRPGRTIRRSASIVTAK